MTTATERSGIIAVIACGICMVGSCLYLAIEARGFGRLLPHNRGSLIAFIVAQVLLGILWMAGWLQARKVTGRGVYWFIVICGLLCRIILIPAPPVLATDYNRYLWDGLMICHGGNPWTIAPRAAIRAGEALRRGHTVAGAALRKAGRLANKYPAVMRRINHSKFPTIYPPAAEAVFALSAWTMPMSSGSLKFFYVGADCITLVLLTALLVELKSSINLIMVYWLNPIVVNSFFNQAHMDLLAFPFIILAVLLAVRGSLVKGGISLALAAAAKFWPLVLLPLLMRCGEGRPWSRLKAGIAFAGVLALALAPMLLSRAMGADSLLAYGRYWHDNDGFFRVEQWFWRAVCGWHPWHGLPAGLWARITTGALFIFLLGWLIRRPIHRTDLTRKMAICIAAVFILSPTEFPWYYTWALPLLATAPLYSILAYTVTLPFYELHNDPAGIVWLQHLPVFGLIILEWWFYVKHRRKNAVKAGDQM